MSLLVRVSLAFKKAIASVKATFGNNVINCLTVPTTDKKGLVSFTDLPVPVSELRELNDNLIAAAAAKEDGGRSATQALKTAVAAWNNAFTLTANYINLVANGDTSVILSAGFVPTKSQRQPKAKPGAVTGFKATINGTRGTIVAGTNKGVPASRGYVVAVVPTSASVTYVNDTMIVTIGEERIYINANTRGTTELYNLESGMPYNVSMFAFNTAGIGPASATQQVIPQ